MRRSRQHSFVAELISEVNFRIQSEILAKKLPSEINSEELKKIISRKVLKYKRK